jgi:hypothetical protein
MMMMMRMRQQIETAQRVQGRLLLPSHHGMMMMMRMRQQIWMLLAWT